MQINEFGVYFVFCVYAVFGQRRTHTANSCLYPRWLVWDGFDASQSRSQHQRVSPRYISIHPLFYILPFQSWYWSKCRIKMQVLLEATLFIMQPSVGLTRQCCSFYLVAVRSQSLNFLTKMVQDRVFICWLWILFDGAADPLAVNDDSLTPLDMARTRGHVAVVRMIEVRCLLPMVIIWA